MSSNLLSPGNRGRHRITCAPGLRWKSPFSRAGWQALLDVMLEKAGAAGRTVELALVDDAAMAELNLTNLGCQGPTNVLSFPVGEEPGQDAGAFLGWLALSLDTARREAFLYGQEVDVHCIRLTAHGVAHLLGHDHGPVMDALAAAMEEAALSLVLRRL